MGCQLTVNVLRLSAVISTGQHEVALMEHDIFMSNAAPHTAKAIMFTCMDERLEDSIEAAIHQLAGGAFHAAMAGGGAAITFESDRATALKQIVAAFKINHIGDVYLQSHLECGAYGLSGITFTSQFQEADRLHQDLDIAKAAVEAALVEAGALPNEVVVHTSVVDLDGHTIERPQTATV